MEVLRQSRIDCCCTIILNSRYDVKSGKCAHEAHWKFEENLKTEILINLLQNTYNQLQSVKNGMPQNPTKLAPPKRSSSSCPSDSSPHDQSPPVHPIPIHLIHLIRLICKFLRLRRILERACKRQQTEKH